MAIAYDIPKLFQMWHAGASRSKICKTLGVAEGSLSALVRKHKLPKRDPPMRGNKVYIPTPEEIVARAAWVREHMWDKDRRDGVSGCVSEIPCYSWSQSRKRYSVVS